MLRPLPRARHLHRAGVRLARAAHPGDDPFGEEYPDFFVVIEFWVPFELRERCYARCLVVRGVECELEALVKPSIALRPEVRSRLRDREVDVEDDGAQRLPAGRHTN